MSAESYANGRSNAVGGDVQPQRVSRVDAYGQMTMKEVIEAVMKAKAIPRMPKTEMKDAHSYVRKWVLSRNGKTTMIDFLYCALVFGSSQHEKCQGIPIETLKLLDAYMEEMWKEIDEEEKQKV